MDIIAERKRKDGFVAHLAQISILREEKSVKETKLLIDRL